ncbi:MAG: alginate export family protein [Pseudomonadota bacterium]
MILLASAILRTVLVGVDSPPCPPNFERLRYNEDYACLEEDDASVLPKRLNLGSIYSLTVGGELRQRLTYVKNFEFGASQTNGDWYNTQRYFVHLDQRLFRDLQVFVQVGSLVQVDLETGPSPIERNDFDLLQGFARYDAGWLRPWAGRRVLQFGSQRLVSRREGPNVRRTFDGAGFEFDSEWLQGHLFLSREVEVRPDGIFNDWETTSPELWGTYFTAPVRLGSLDIYYLGTHFESASYARGEGQCVACR